MADDVNELVGGADSGAAKAASTLGGKKAKNEAKESGEKITVGATELQAIVAAAVAAALDKAQGAQVESAKIIAEALIEARKPYKDPNQEENQKRMREQMRETQERIRKNIEASRDACPHLQGSNPLSSFQGQSGSFVLHTLDTGEMIGICTNCLKVISSSNRDDIKFFQKKNGNVPSAAGQRIFFDPLKVRAAGQLKDDGGHRLTGV